MPAEVAILRRARGLARRFVPLENRLALWWAGITPSPIVELNRAVAVSMASGPAAGLEIVDRLTGEPSLRGYHPLPSVRGAERRDAATTS